jgi:hypothetical protein
MRLWNRKITNLTSSSIVCFVHAQQKKVQQRNKSQQMLTRKNWNGLREKTDRSLQKISRFFVM